jgi:dynein light chain 1
MTAKATPCKAALAQWLAGPGGGAAAGDVERVELTGICPPMDKMDSSLGTLRSCRHLALSTNNLEKIGNLSGLERLEVLSLGRNCLKKLENLEGVAGSLQQLWVSYNQIDRLVSCRLAGCLYMCVLAWQMPAELADRSCIGHPLL